MGGGRRHRCIVPYGVAVAAAARMGSIVLRLCRTSTPPANPPVGGCMPVNYCTFGERRRRRKKTEEEEKKKKEEDREREMRSTGRRGRRRGGGVKDT